MGPAKYLADKSVLARGHLDVVKERFDPRIAAGTVGISIATELEVGFSARSVSDHVQLRSALARLLPIALPTRAEQRAREVQAALVERGQHRAVSVADLLVAATAEIERLTVLHYDADFDLIAEVTGQDVEWIVPRGSVD